MERFGCPFFATGIGDTVFEGGVVDTITNAKAAFGIVNHLGIFDADIVGADLRFGCRSTAGENKAVTCFADLNVFDDCRLR